MQTNLDSSIILILLAPVFVIFLLIEFIYYYKKKLNIYNLKDTFANFSLSFMFQVSDIIFTIIIVKTVYTWVYQHGMHLFSQPIWYNIFILFIGQDFLYYWFHRTAHRVRFIWSSHVTHHSSTNLNFSTAFRQSMTYPISGMWLFWIPLAYIGFTPDEVLLIVGLNLGFQFFVHTQLVNKLGFIEKIFNTPSHHRVHHGKNPKYIDKNYAGVFIIWDKIFGTYEEEEEIPIYGITRPIKSFNPITLTFHEWKSMLKDIIKDKDLRHLWMPPNWTDYKDKESQPELAKFNKY